MTRSDIATPFHPRLNDAEILLLDEGETVEVIIHRIPEPTRYYINSPDSTEDQLRENAVARWIIEETLEIVSDYDPDLSSYTTNSGKTHLRDVYFTCDRTEINEAVLRAREVLHTIEKKRFKHQQEFRESTGNSPEKDLGDY